MWWPGRAPPARDLPAVLGIVDAALCTVATAVQFRRPREVPLEQRILRLRTTYERPGFSRPQRAAAYAPFAGILVTFATIGYPSTVPSGASSDLSLAAAGPDGTTATLPTTGGVNSTISRTVEVGNNASAQSRVLSVSSILVGQKATSLAAVLWTRPIHLAPIVTSSEALALSGDVRSGVGSPSGAARAETTGSCSRVARPGPPPRCVRPPSRT